MSQLLLSVIIEAFLIKIFKYIMLSILYIKNTYNCKVNLTYIIMKIKLIRIMALILGITASIIVELFVEGGILFMSILTLLLIAVIVSYFKYPQKVGLLGNISLAVGILGTLIGLFSAFMIIQQVGDISPSILAGGLKVAFISTMYGLIIYIFSLGLMTLSKE